MSNPSRWLNWTPGQRPIIEIPPEGEPTKPSKRGFVGFDGSVSGENQIIRELETPSASVSSDPQTTADSADPAPTKPCHACHGTRWWLSVNGPVVCGTCHPPANPALVRRWYELPIIGKSLPPEPTKPSELPADILSDMASKAPSLEEVKASLPPGVRLVNYQPREVPFAVAPVSIVTQAGKFYRAYLADLARRLEKPEGYHCPPLSDILSKLSSAGLELMIEAPATRAGK
jgi:hypothetical protein